MTVCDTTKKNFRPRLPALVLALVLVPYTNVGAQERMLPIPADKQTDAQKKAVEEYKVARPAGPFAFWWLYLRIPEVTIPFLRIQEHVHMNSRLGERLTQNVSDATYARALAKFGEEARGERLDQHLRRVERLLPHLCSGRGRQLGSLYAMYSPE